MCLPWMNLRRSVGLKRPCQLQPALQDPVSRAPTACVPSISTRKAGSPKRKNQRLPPKALVLGSPMPEQGAGIAAQRRITSRGAPRLRFPSQSLGHCAPSSETFRREPKNNGSVHVGKGPLLRRDPGGFPARESSPTQTKAPGDPVRCSGTTRSKPRQSCYGIILASSAACPRPGSLRQELIPVRMDHPQPSPSSAALRQSRP